MNWTIVIADLMKVGLSQTRLAELCGVAQSTISDLHRGATKSPSFELGRKLMGLHEQHVETLPATAVPTHVAAEAGHAG